MVRAVDNAYPLLGTVVLSGPPNLAAGLEDREGIPGALVGPGLLRALSIAIGDTIAIGEAAFEVRGLLQSAPDQGSDGVTIGAPMMISLSALEAAGTLQDGALSRYRYRIVLRQGESWTSATDRIRAALPDAGWQITAPSQVTDEMSEYFVLFARFLMVVGLSSLLVGGIGVGNAVSSYVADRQSTIATMKSLGATRARVLAHFLLQVGILALIGIAIGLVLRALLTLVVLPLLGPTVGLPLTATMDWGSLGRAALFGALASFVFAYLPLYRAQATSPALLFRSIGGPPASSMLPGDYLAPAFILPMSIAVAGLLAMASVATGSFTLVLWYSLGIAVAFLALVVTARVLRLALRAVPPLPNARLRNAIKAIYRPGTPAPAIMLSLGLGMALLVLIATVVNDLRHQLDPEVRVDAPNFVYMDLFDDEEQALAELARSDGRIERYTSNPVLRTSSIRINGGAPVTPGQLTRDISMFFGDEQPLTQADTLPGGNVIVQGTWWDADYEGPPLLSVSEQMAVALQINIGDRVTFEVAGDEIIAEVASVRRYDWQKGRINFPLVLSPHAFDEFPLAWFAFIRVVKGNEAAIEALLNEQFPDLVYIPVDEALTSVLGLLSGFSNAVSIVGSVSVLSGLLVLGGAMASRRRQREEESVIVKVLGSTRSELVLSYLLEYGLVGAIAAAIATGLGILGAWLFATRILETRFSIDPLLLLSVIGAAIVLTTTIGALTMWSALSVKPAERLRGQ
jgi:putative ABC transport system permease protein